MEERATERAETKKNEVSGRITITRRRRRGTRMKSESETAENPLRYRHPNEKKNRFY